MTIPDMQKVGEAEMQVMFWRIYRAELYSATLPFERQNYPQLLSITYLRNISQQDLLDATRKQWQKLAVKDSAQQAWIGQLSQIWPAVKKGDQIQLLVDEQQHSHFYLKQQPIGSISDPEFSSAFLDIWLSEKTSRPDLRAQLLGEKR